MPIETTVYRRETADASEAVTVMSSIDDDGAEIRVIHERDGAIVADTIPHWGPDPVAGRHWLDRHRDACVADGYRIVDQHDGIDR